MAGWSSSNWWGNLLYPSLFHHSNPRHWPIQRTCNDNAEQHTEVSKGARLAICKEGWWRMQWNLLRRRALRKFGIEKVFKFLFEECLPSDEEWANTRSGNLPLFMVAASSCERCTVSVIYHLLRRNVHDALLSGNDGGVSKKRKLGSNWLWRQQMIIY